MDLHQWVSLISSCTALVAVVASPVLSWKIAKKQIAASTVTANRQVWINTLRDSLSEFIAKNNLAQKLVLQGYANASSIQRLEEVLTLNAKIDLLINPKETDHIQLAKLVEDMTNDMGRASKGHGETPDSCRRELTEISQRILKREWEVVKQGM